jgi:hypothetical protein
VGPAVEASLVGLTLDRVPAVLAGFGAPGRRLAAALAKARGPG